MAALALQLLKNGATAAANTPAGAGLLAGIKQFLVGTPLRAGLTGGATGLMLASNTPPSYALNSSAALALQGYGYTPGTLV